MLASLRLGAIALVLTGLPTVARAECSGTTCADCVNDLACGWCNSAAASEACQKGTLERPASSTSLCYSKSNWISPGRVSQCPENVGKEASPLITALIIIILICTCVCSVVCCCGCVIGLFVFVACLDEKPKCCRSSADDALPRATAGRTTELVQTAALVSAPGAAHSVAHALPAAYAEGGFSASQPVVVAHMHGNQRTNELDAADTAVRAAMGMPLRQALPSAEPVAVSAIVVQSTGVTAQPTQVASAAYVVC